MRAANTASKDDDRINWPALLAFWLAISVFLVARAILSADRTPLLLDTDDAMRLVVVRDFLAGQNWFDHTQYRLNTPFGADIHWSRLVDLPIAGLILLLRPLFGAFAETLTAYIWPLLLLLGLLTLSTRLTLRLVGKAGLLPALALPVLAPAVIPEFSPGRLDHHSIQILLTLTLVWCSIEALQRPRWAIGAGLAAATALAIGTEAVPAVAAAILVFGMLWVLRPERADALRNFGLSFAVATLAHLAIAQPPSLWFVAACDELSAVYAVAAVLVGFAFLVLSTLPLSIRPLWLRLLLAAISGTIVLGVLLRLFPDCLRGPYAALDPWLVEHWLDRIAEAKPLWESILSRPDLTIGMALPPILGLLLVGWIANRPTEPHRDRWLVLGAFMLAAVLVMLVQIRGGRLAMPLAVPAGAWLIVAARSRYLTGRKPLAIAGLVGSWLVFAGIAVLLVVNYATLALVHVVPGATGEAGGSTEACLLPSAYDDLAALPAERVMTPVDLGSHLLLFTPHAVVAAPYHRNQQGVRDSFDFFDGPIENARAILDRRGITLVVVCPQMVARHDPSLVAAESFASLYARNALPDWLQDVSLPGAALKVFAVTPAAAQP